MRNVVVVMRSLYLRLEGFVLALPVHRRHLFFLYVYVFFLFFIPSFVRACVCVTAELDLNAIHSGADGGADR